MKHTKRWLALLLAVVTVFTTVIITGCSTNKAPDEQGESISTQPDVFDENGEEMVSGKVYAMAKTMSFTAPTMLSTTARSGITLEATVTPLTASNRTVDWSVDWVDPSSSFASGKTAANYIRVSPLTDGSTIATVTCLAEFGSQIKITVTSRDNPDASAVCTVDYRKRITGYSVSFFGGSKTVSDGATASVKLSSSNETALGDTTPSASYGIGTVAGESVSLGSAFAFDPNEMSTMLKDYYTSTVRATLPYAMQLAIDGGIDDYVEACHAMTSEMLSKPSNKTFKEMVTPLVQLAIFSQTTDLFTQLIQSYPVATLRIGDANDESSWSDIYIFISDGVFEVSLTDDNIVI